MEKLRRGQIIMIDSQKYVVNNMIEFKEDSWIKKEFIESILKGEDPLKNIKKKDDMER